LSSGAVCSQPTRRTAQRQHARRGSEASNDSLPVGKRHSDDDDDAHDEKAQLHSSSAMASAASGSKAGEATQHVHVEPHRNWLAFLDERHSVCFQSSATHVETLRRMADRAFADPSLSTTSPSSLAARCLLLRWCTRFVDEGAFKVTLMSLPAPRAAVPLGARLVRRAADVARGREPRRGRAVAQQHDGAVCRDCDRTTRRSAGACLSMTRMRSGS
jgi:hypothetical protein